MTFKPTNNPRIIFTATPEDHALVEKLRAKMGLRSHAAVLRKLLRDAAKAQGLKTSPESEEPRR